MYIYMGEERKRRKGSSSQIAKRNFSFPFDNRNILTLLRTHFNHISSHTFDSPTPSSASYLTSLNLKKLQYDDET